jgi:hypothetical protein
MSGPHPEGGDRKPYAEMTVAGVPLSPMGTEPHEYINTDLLDVDGRLLLGQLMANRAVRDGLGLKDTRGEFDPRIVRLDVRGTETPRYRFLLNDMLFRDVRSLQLECAPERPGQDTILRAALQQTEGAVRPDFAHDAINDVNLSYFRSPVAFSPAAGLARVFTHNMAVNASVGALIGEHFAGRKDELRIKELCAGPDAEHWGLRTDGVLAFGAGRVALTLSDIKPPKVPKKPGRRMSMRAERYSLLEDMPNLRPKDRYDALITTYGFDSVWQPEDMRLWRCGDQWFRATYRVKVADWNPRRDDLLQSLRTGLALWRAAPADYEGIFVEEAWLPMATADVPYADFLYNYPAGRPTNVPGGMIKRIAEAFEKQLRPNGVFVVGDITDTASIGEWGSLASDVSGVAERYKVEDYMLAARILEKNYGLQAQFRSLKDVVSDYVEDWREVVMPQEIQTIARDVSTGLLVVSRPV